MDIKKLKKIIEEKYGWDKFADLVKESEFIDKADENFLEKTGLKFVGVEAERKDAYYWFVFNIEGQNYMATGPYDSEWGASLDSYDVKDFWPVTKKTKTIEVWE